MNNVTTDQSNFESLNINSKTTTFACLELDVAELIGSIRWDAASILCWRRSSSWFAHQMLMRMGGEFISLEYRAADLARAFCSRLVESAGKSQVNRWIAKLKEDQELSGFEMIQIDSDRRRRRDDGSFCHLPTLYTPSGFPLLYRAMQDAAKECDLCALPLRERRARQRSIAESWLLAQGCRPIVRAAKQPANQSANQPVNQPTPCTCKRKCRPECACVCATATSNAPAGRITGDDVERRITQGFELLFEAGQDWMSLGKGLPDYVRKITAGCETGVELRLRDAVARSNKPKLKLMGGQAK